MPRTTDPNPDPAAAGPDGLLATRHLTGADGGPDPDRYIKVLIHDEGLIIDAFDHVAGVATHVSTLEELWALLIQAAT